MPSDNTSDQQPNIEWRVLTDEEMQAAAEYEHPDCECSLKDDPRCTLDIEEGQARVTHVACGKPLWIYPEDIFAEFPVTVGVETCSNPGGWHGMERCDCGPSVIIEHDPRQ